MIEKPCTIETSEQRYQQGVVVSADIVSKLAILEVSLNEGFRRLDEKMSRFQSDLHDNQVAVTLRITELDKEVNNKFAIKRTKLEVLDHRVNDIETWQKVAMAKVTVLVGAASIILTLFAPTFRHILGVPD